MQPGMAVAGRSRASLERFAHRPLGGRGDARCAPDALHCLQDRRGRVPPAGRSCAPRCPRAGASSAWRPALAEERPRAATVAVIDQHQVVPEPKTVAQRSPRLRALASSSFTSICAYSARSRSMAQVVNIDARDRAAVLWALGLLSATPILDF